MCIRRPEGEDTQGLIHISEVSNTYVKDHNDFLTVGQEVEVKVIKVDTEKNKISLSIRALMPDPEGRGKRESKGESRENNNGNAPRAPKRNAGGGRRRGVASPKIENTEEGYNVLGEKLREARNWTNDLEPSLPVIRSASRRTFSISKEKEGKSACNGGFAFFFPLMVFSICQLYNA